jgi:hypothetical protein
MLSLILPQIPWIDPQRRMPRMRAGVQKVGLPCSRGRPQIGRDHAKKVPLAQRREGSKPVISSGN